MGEISDKNNARAAMAGIMNLKAFDQSQLLKLLAREEGRFELPFRCLTMNSTIGALTKRRLGALSTILFFRESSSRPMVVPSVGTQLAPWLFSFIL
jgi:hypothetical protein